MLGNFDINLSPSRVLLSQAVSLWRNASAELADRALAPRFTVADANNTQAAVDVFLNAEDVASWLGASLPGGGNEGLMSNLTFKSTNREFDVKGAAAYDKINEELYVIVSLSSSLFALN